MHHVYFQKSFVVLINTSNIILKLKMISKQKTIASKLNQER